MSYTRGNTRGETGQMDFLDFEQPVAELEAKIRELHHIGADVDVDVASEIERLRKRRKALIEDIFADLSAWQITQLARHPERPYTNDYLARLLGEFHEMHGDQMFADDAAIIAGFGRLEDIAVLVIGHQKGRDIHERKNRNFGMPHPEGYRKARRLMQMAERFGIPVLTFIDTPGAWPGIGAEERGQSEAIARNLEVMAGLRVPIVTTIIGEGGSGGALAVGVADHVLMLQYSIYSVISPEGCASILWKSQEYAQDAAEAMGLTSNRLLKMGLVDEVLEEPLGGAHRDPDEMAQRLRATLLSRLRKLCAEDPDALVRARQERLLGVGEFSE